MSLMFQATPSIKNAVVLINDLDPSKFPLLLSRIIQKLHLKDERTFSEEEEEKLQKAFSLPASDLELVFQTLEFFLQQAAYHLAKPAIFSEQLKQLGLIEEKVNTIIGTWQGSARDTVQRLRQRTIAPKQLTDVNWRLNLQMAQAAATKQKIPNAMFELGITDEDNREKEKIRLEFTHEELYKFYSQLETVQKQLDSLS